MEDHVEVMITILIPQGLLCCIDNHQAAAALAVAYTAVAAADAEICLSVP